MTNQNDYLDKNKYPLTTQGNLSENGQRMIDAFNYDSLVEAVDFKEELSMEQIARFKELSEKLNRSLPDGL